MPFHGRQLAQTSHAALKPLRWLRARTNYLEGLNHLWLEITKSCNLTCEHCYVSSGPHLPVTQRMQTDDWCRVMRESYALGCRRVQFIGGEPTIHPDLPHLLHYAWNSGLWSEVFTNATLLSDELIDCFERLSVLVAFSFYSVEPEVHDRITGHKGSFERTVEGLTRLSERKIRLRAGLVAIEQSGDDVAHAQEMLRGFGVTDMYVDRLRGIGRGEQRLPDANPMNELCGECWRGKLSIDPDGDAFPCVFSRFYPLGNVLDDGMETIVRSRSLRTFRREGYID